VAQIEFVPNVTRDERTTLEQDSRDYYNKEYPYIEYQGFVGTEPDSSGALSLQPRSEQNFYFPIHFMEPIKGSEVAIDLDAYSRPAARIPIDIALQTWKPSLSEPVRLVEESHQYAFSVFLIHPVSV
jgi:CHASE1-domain containing sensor protein